MKFTLAVLTLASTTSAFSVDSSKPLLQVTKGFLSQDQVAQIKNNDIDGIGGSGQYFGQAVLDQGIVERLPREATQSIASLPVMTKVMLESTNWHMDECVENEDGSMVPEDTAFIFLNSNADAKFVYGDDRTEVPVVAGDLVQFKGNVMHNTEVEKGQVMLAGPFFMDSLNVRMMLLDDCDSNADCGVSQECVANKCTERSDRALAEASGRAVTALRGSQ